MRGTPSEAEGSSFRAAGEDMTRVSRLLRGVARPRSMFLAPASAPHPTDQTMPDDSFYIGYHPVAPTDTARPVAA